MIEKRIDAHGSWRFGIDRGGTFTDIVAVSEAGAVRTLKLLSDNPEHYDDAAIEGIRRVLGVGRGEDIPASIISAVRIGTTVATNALLERKGEPTALLITEGLGDALRIGYQNRPRLFERNITLPIPLYDTVVQIRERVDAHGTILKPLDEVHAIEALKDLRDKGIQSVAICLMHSYRFPAHERRLAQLARELGFTQVSASNEVSPLIKLIPRGDTTVVDAYLTPSLRNYVKSLSEFLDGISVTFMQSNGGLARAANFQGKDAVLSGPAGGIVGMIGTAKAAGFDRIIGFDMGGTSTDVSHFAGEIEREFETVVAGVRLRAPMLSIHTVAAGGGSILHFDGRTFKVGPDSAGANPGPASYGRGGPLTITDCNILLGRIRPDRFPAVFGPSGNQPLDEEIVTQKFMSLAAEISEATGIDHCAEEVAEGFLLIAVSNMARAIAKISLARGYDLSGYVLNAFGGAGAQHACMVADQLGIEKIFLHPAAGVLSAYGIGIAELTTIREQTAELILDDGATDRLGNMFNALQLEACNELIAQGAEKAKIRLTRRVEVRYRGTDTSLIVDFGSHREMLSQFEDLHWKRFSFLIPDRAIVVGTIQLEARAASEAPNVAEWTAEADGLDRAKKTRVYIGGRWTDAALRSRNELAEGEALQGPAIIVEPNSTIVVDVGWIAEGRDTGEIVLTRTSPLSARKLSTDRPNPVTLEIMNNRFMAIAEQMGLRLRQTAQSVNIKERLDFSCAIFDRRGNLVANAPHIPVHLGSMGNSVRMVMEAGAGSVRPGDVYAINDPYKGGTHLPDITVVTPIFDRSEDDILFYVGSRGHHSDIGGITPGSMPPHSKTVDEEGVRFTNWKLVEGGRLREQETRTLLLANPHPARNPDQNIADLCAQVAANAKGAEELHKMMLEFGSDVVEAYTQFVQDNAEAAVREVISALSDGHFALEMDSGARIQVSIRVDRTARSATVDFTGTSPQQPDNFNAPASIASAATLYVFRTLIDREIPLNAGCLKPIEIIAPDGSMLNPRYPAAVVAGNVETSQCITNALYGALGVSAASQCTMNTLSFGNASYQYIETIAGGVGASPGYHGASAVHTNMTNSLITDPEILELRYPVLLEHFAVRKESGGQGSWRGGDGVSRRIRFGEPMTVSILSNNRRIPPFGLDGGQAGKTGRNVVVRANGESQDLPGCAGIEINKGDSIVIETPGGGGVGAASDRSSEGELVADRASVMGGNLAK